MRIRKFDIEEVDMRAREYPPTIQQLEEYRLASSAIDYSKKKLSSEMKEIIHQLNRLTTRFIELEGKLM